MPPLIEFRSVSKRFPGVQALSGISLAVERGSCHALVGENGAGKSTLAKILAGICAPDEGDVHMDGRRVRFHSPRDARLAGIGMVHQELAFCENLSVAENLCLGELPRRGGLVARREMLERAQKALEAIGAAVPAAALIGELPVGQQQLVQVAGAVASGARVLIFDEPTSSLSRVEADHLLDLVRRLTARGVTSLYVSHRLEEIFGVCDTVTVLRDGEKVGTQAARDLTRERLVQMMVGRMVQAARAPAPAAAPPWETARLSVRRLSSPGRFQDVSLQVRAGEVVGMAGLVGAGRTEVLEAIFGLDRQSTGELLVDGRRVDVRHPGEALSHDIGLVPEDRKRHGLILEMSVKENISLPTLPRVSRLAWILGDEERRQSSQYVERLRIRTPGLDTAVTTLSGGNQQKVVMARWLAAQSRILLLDEPTRGVDVGAKAELHSLIREWARGGHAVLFASSELPEILGLADRIIVMRNGHVAGELQADLASEESVLSLMAGVHAPAPA